MVSVWGKRSKNVRTTTQPVSARSGLAWLAISSGSVSSAEEVAVSAQLQSHNPYQQYQPRPVKTITQLENARNLPHRLVTFDGLVSSAEELAGSAEIWKEIIGMLG